MTIDWLVSWTGMFKRLLISSPVLLCPWNVCSVFAFPTSRGCSKGIALGQRCDVYLHGICDGAQPGPSYKRLRFGGYMWEFIYLAHTQDKSHIQVPFPIIKIATYQDGKVCFFLWSFPDLYMHMGANSNYIRKAHERAVNLHVHSTFNLILTALKYFTLLIIYSSLNYSCIWLLWYYILLVFYLLLCPFLLLLFCRLVFTCSLNVPQCVWILWSASNRKLNSKGFEK